MKTSKWLIIVTAAVAIAVCGLFAAKTHAAEKSGRRPLQRGAAGERMKERLGLTEEQTSKIKEELKTEKESLSGLIGNLHQARIALREAIHASDATETSVRAAAAKVAVVEADLAVERLKLYGRINPILTADQRQTLKQVEERVDDLIDELVNRFEARLGE